ncbi:MAG: hypothetical protein KF838_00340 [Phycisphaeraceae bacterium]|nr:MAG: hypothetical protein KF838_00340 [Phycisphaeraceae bacterium]
MSWLADAHAIARPMLLLLRTAEGWLTWRAGLILVGLLSCFAPAWLYVDWSAQHSPKSEFPLLTVLAWYAAGFTILLATWIVAREVYWRTGRGTRIAVSFASHHVDPSDLLIVRKTFDNIGRSSRCATYMSFRAFPTSPSSTTADQKRIAARYKFALSLRVSVSPITKDSATYHYTVDAMVASQKLDAKFRESITRLIQHLGIEPAGPSSVMNDLRRRAEWLHEAVLATLGMVAVCERRLADAGNILEYLDSALSRRLPADDDRRQYIRHMCCLCLMETSWYPGTGPGGTDQLQRAIADAHRAIQLCDSEFKWVYATQARNYFFAGDLEKSIGCNNKCLQIDPNESQAVLNHAVLMLLTDKYVDAADTFRRYLSSPDAPQTDWRDLIDFADVASEMGHENAIFIQCLYRGVIPGFTIPTTLTASLEAWLDASAERKPLRQLYANRPRYKRLAQPA